MVTVDVGDTDDIGIAGVSVVDVVCMIADIVAVDVVYDIHVGVGVGDVAVIVNVVLLVVVVVMTMAMLLLRWLSC